jgi:hypothetical protein
MAKTLLWNQHPSSLKLQHEMTKLTSTLKPFSQFSSTPSSERVRAPPACAKASPLSVSVRHRPVGAFPWWRPRPRCRSPASWRRRRWCQPLNGARPRPARRPQRSRGALTEIQRVEASSSASAGRISALPMLWSAHGHALERGPRSPCSRCSGARRPASVGGFVVARTAVSAGRRSRVNIGRMCSLTVCARDCDIDFCLIWIHSRNFPCVLNFFPDANEKLNAASPFCYAEIGASCTLHFIVCLFWCSFPFV